MSEGKNTQIAAVETGFTALANNNILEEALADVEVEDPTKAVRWLKRNKFLTAFRVPEPEVAKAEVRKLISAGKKIPGCSIVDDVSCKLK